MNKGFKLLKKWFSRNNDTLCPVCKQHHFSKTKSFDICPICGWEDDCLQRKNPDFKGGANKMSLNEAISAYKCGGKVE